MDSNDVHLYVGAYSKVPGVKSGWIWYRTGASDAIAWPWHNYQPDNSGGVEYCMDYYYINGCCWGMNDIPCNYGGFQTATICESVTTRTHGFKPK